MESREKNVGNLDSALRWTVGLTVLALGFSRRKWWGVLGLVPFYSAATRYCAVNKALGINTVEDESKPKTEFSPLPQTKVVKDRTPLVANAIRGPVHFESKHPHLQKDHTHHMYVNEHNTRVGNGPGERNHIGGRSSGQTPRYS